MYVPDAFAVKDAAWIATTIDENSFGLLVTAPPGEAPRATPLPFLFDPTAGSHGILHAHMSRANPQWKDFALLEEAGLEALVIFQGPHGYISPRWYETKGNVPTWNYVAVHAYGRPRLIETAEQVVANQARLVARHEAGAAQPWSMEAEDPKFISRMLRGIVSFELMITRIEGKAKLSQNKQPADITGAIAGLERDGDTSSLELADLMRRQNGLG